MYCNRQAFLSLVHFFLCVSDTCWCFPAVLKWHCTKASATECLCAARTCERLARCSSSPVTPILSWHASRAPSRTPLAQLHLLPTCCPSLYIMDMVPLALTSIPAVECAASEASHMSALPGHRFLTCLQLTHCSASSLHQSLHFQAAGTWVPGTSCSLAVLVFSSPALGRAALLHHHYSAVLPQCVLTWCANASHAPPPSTDALCC